MSFEVYDRKRRPVTGTPMVAFTKLGRINFNIVATRELENKKVMAVLLLWDKETRRVGIRPTTNDDVRSYKLHKSGKGNASGFSASTFLEYIGFDPSQSRSIAASWNDIDSMYVVEVPAEYLKPGSTVRKRGRVEANTSSA